MFKKALTLDADSLIFDLEDSVAPGDKDLARSLVCTWLGEADFAGKEVLVRINPLESHWGRADLDAIMHTPPDGIVVPKVLSPSDVEAIDRFLTALELERNLESGQVPLLLIGTEVPGAVFNLHRTVAHKRVQGVAWGAEDLSTAIGARVKRDRDGNYLEVFSLVRSLCLLAATGAGIQPIDAPFVNIGDVSGLKKECDLAANMGFTGKLTIHPEQIEIVNDAFTPSAAEVDRARELLEAFDASEGESRMAFTFRGEMVDAAHLKHARNIVARADNLKSRR